MLDIETPAVPGAAVAPHGTAAPRGTRFERWLIVFLSLAMIGLPTLDAILRRLTGSALPGAAVYTQHFTLWIGFVGALLATGNGKHLALSTGEFLPPGKWRDRAAVVGHVISTFVCIVLAYASLDFIIASTQSRNLLAGGIPEWWFETIMPVALVWMAIRFALMAPTKWSRRACVALILVVVPFAVARISAARGVPLFPAPDGSLLFGGRTAFYTWPGAVLLTIGFLLGTPVFIVMAGLALLFFFAEGTPVASVPAETFRLVLSPTLPAIPLLTMAGYILAEGGASQRLVRAAQSVFGWMPGGLAVMACFVCALFTTFTGASGVTILALGGLILPSLVREGYREKFSLGLVTAAGSLGLLFPPSLPVILYGVVAEVPIENLYIAGLVPGLLMILLVAAYGVVEGVRKKVPTTKFDPREAAKAVWAAKWDLLLPVLVIVMVASGWATIVEAAAVGAAYALIVELAIYRDIRPVKDLPRVLVHSATLVGSVLILLGVALGLTAYLVEAEIPTALLTWVQTHIHSQWAFLLVLNVLLLVLGSVLEIYSAIVVLAPLIRPLGEAFGVDPVHLGVVFLANLELGFLFPPVGLNLFLSASRFQKPLPLLYKVSVPFLIIMAVGVLLITYVPALTIGVVAAIKG